MTEKLNWSKWLYETRFGYMTDKQREQTERWLSLVRNIVLQNANIQEDNVVIDIGTGTGLLGLGALHCISPEGKVIFSDKFQDCLDECKQFLSQFETDRKYEFLLSDCLDIQLPDESVDRAMTRSVLVHIEDKISALKEIYRILKPGGIYSAFEPVIKSNTQYWELLNPKKITNFEAFKQAEIACMSDENNPLTNFDEKTIAEYLDNIGFSNGIIDKQIAESKYVVSEGMIDNWWSLPPSPTAKPMKERFLEYFTKDEIDTYLQEMKACLKGKKIKTKSNVLFIKAIK